MKKTLKPTNLNEAVEKIAAERVLDPCPKEMVPAIEDCKHLINAAENLDFGTDDYLLTIDQAAMLLGTSQQTLRNWEKERKLIPIYKTGGGHRRYSKTQIESLKKEEMQECEVLLPGISPVHIWDTLKQVMGNFDPTQNVNIGIKVSHSRHKVYFTVDSEDGLSSITKVFNMED